MRSYKVPLRGNSPWTRVSGLGFSQAEAQRLKVLRSTAKTQVWRENPQACVLKTQPTCSQAEAKLSSTSSSVLSAVTGYPIASHLLRGRWGKATDPPWKQKSTRSLHPRYSCQPLSDGCRRLTRGVRGQLAGEGRLWLRTWSRTEAIMWANTAFIPKPVIIKSVSEWKYNL